MRKDKERTRVHHKQQKRNASGCVPTTLHMLRYDPEDLYTYAKAHQGVSKPLYIRILKKLGGERVRKTDKIKPGKPIVAVTKNHTYLVDGSTLHDPWFRFGIPFMGMRRLRRDEKAGRLKGMYHVDTASRPDSPLPKVRRGFFR